MKDPRAIILYPIVTERAVNLKDKANKYTFCVVREANKIEIKSAIEELFKVKVLRVTTIQMKGKPKRLGRFEGKRASWKKAICTLNPGDKIEIFEGV
ncbi:50S ribosomal protein L23 [candidate division WOR-3 bacterium]|nr:50S ribosomal protein L23 [candidate division WOR-3 bacterium]